jgi:hypothetical protein
VEAASCNPKLGFHVLGVGEQVSSVHGVAKEHVHLCDTPGFTIATTM